MTIRDRLLGTKAGYSVFRRVIRADRSMQWLVDQHFRPVAGQRLLDVGCGTGDLALLVPDVTYVGVDHNPAYINAGAADAEPGKPQFVHGELSALGEMDLGRFDIAVAVGVLHHLDDDLARAAVAGVRNLLAPGGRFISVDPAFHPDQRAIARVLMALDRGRYVRHPADYERIMSSSFDRAEMTIRHDLNPFPYTHCIIDATM